MSTFSETEERQELRKQVAKLAATYQRMDRPADANRHCTEAVTRFERRIARGADDPATKYYIASLYGLRGDAEKAVRYLRESLAELPALNRVRAGADPDSSTRSLRTRRSRKPSPPACTLRPWYPWRLVLANLRLEPRRIM